MYNLYFVMLGLTVGVLGCMVHAATHRRWSIVQGGAPLLIGFLALAVVFGVAK
jgi:hypothetical protein